MGRSFYVHTSLHIFVFFFYFFHFSVIYDNIPMFDLAVECGATIATRNNQNLNPLTTAAYLAHKDMFFHIANIEREVYWQIGMLFFFIFPT